MRSFAVHKHQLILCDGFFFSNIPKLRYQKLSLVTGSSIFREKLNDLFDGDSNKRKYPMKEKGFLIRKNFT